MEQKNIRDYNGNTYSLSEGAELVNELDDRTKNDEDGYNSIAELAARIKELEPEGHNWAQDDWS